jgi:hypothetical protein
MSSMSENQEDMTSCTYNTLYNSAYTLNRLLLLYENSTNFQTKLNDNTVVISTMYIPYCF